MRETLLPERIMLPFTHLDNMIKNYKTPKPQGKGIVKALGQKGTTGNFKKIEASKGKAAAIGALQNKLAKRRGQPIPYTSKKK